MNHNEKYTALYCRLSSDDGRKDDSLSITNQKQILERYATEQGFVPYKFYVDDGYSGTNFKRPSWQQLESELKQGLISTVIVKDSSRLGREYLQVGQIFEHLFPTYGVRFISVTEGVDTIDGVDEFMPFRSLFNEFYAKESSKKLRAVHRNKALNGRRVGGRAPYGYKKDENNKLIPDEEAATTVQRIFSKALEGKSLSAIGRELEESEILIPSALFFQTTGIALSMYDPNFPYMWSSPTISNILSNEVYIGNVSNLKTTTVSYKNKKRIYNPIEKQILVENAHPAIISKEVFEVVQKMRESRKVPRSKGQSINKFIGLLFCQQCKGKMGFYDKTKSNPSARYYCSTYKHKKKESCTNHFIKESHLVEVVLKSIQDLISFAQEDEDVFVEYLMKKKNAKQNKEFVTLEREINKLNLRTGEISSILKELYEDKVVGNIDNVMFEKLSSKFASEDDDIQSSLLSKTRELEELKLISVSISDFQKQVTQLTTISELTPELLNLLIERIEVGDRITEKPRARKFQQEIDIYFRGIGLLDD